MDRVCRWLLIASVLGLAYSLVVLAVRAPGVAFLAAVFVGWAATRKVEGRGSDVHGTAHWCSEEAARKAGLL
jgi:hypothetical protein